MAHAAGDAHEYPVFGYHYRVTFPLLDEDGDLVTGGASDTPDSERSLDGATFADCTNEIAEIATSSGMYFLDLTGAEMAAKTVAGIVKVASSTTQTTPFVLYPRRLPVLETGTAQAGANGSVTLAAGASAEDDFYNGLFVGITNDSPSGVDNQLRRIIDYDGGTKVAIVDSDWGTNPTVASTYELLIPEGYSVAAWGGTKVADPDTAGHPNTKADVVRLDNSAPAAVNLKQASLAMQVITVQTAEGAANTDTIFDTDLPLENADYYGDTDGGLVIAFVGGEAQQFQTRRIVASATGTLNTRITLEAALDGIPADADVMVVLGRITELS